MNEHSENGQGVELVANDLWKAFGGVNAVAGASLQVRRGLVTALVGPNGAGKTTIFNLITGFLSVDAGLITFRGQPIDRLSPEAVAALGIGRTFQEVRVFERMSVLENVLVYAGGERADRLRDVALVTPRTRRAIHAARRRAMEQLEFVGLDSVPKRKAQDLSYGEQKLLALARILALDPDVILLDEPTSGLDRNYIDMMVELIRSLRHSGRSILIIEHNLDVVKDVADLVVFLDQGQVVAEDTPRAIFADQRLAAVYMGAGV